MDFKEYVKLAMRTNNKQKDFKDNILDGLLGLFGESTEFILANDKNQLNELSDLYWYTALLFNTTGLTPIKIYEPENSLTVAIGILSDHFKKHFFQGHVINSELVQILLSEIKFHLDFISTEFLDSSPEGVWKYNIEKLEKRYPNGFSVEKSINREGK